MPNASARYRKVSRNLPAPAGRALRSDVGIAWIVAVAVAVAAHLVLNERLGLGPPRIEFEYADP